MKQLTFLLIGAAALILYSCDLVISKKSKSEDEIRHEIEMELQHKQDSIRLVEAEARAQKAEARAQQSEAAAKAAKTTTSRQVSSVEPQSYTWLSERLVTESDLYGLSSAEKRVLRNAIYARHGYKFKSADLLNYFSQFSWYQPLYSNVESSLSSIERKNVQFIKARE